MNRKNSFSSLQAIKAAFNNVDDAIDIINLRILDALRQDHYADGLEARISVGWSGITITLVRFDSATRNAEGVWVKKIAATTYCTVDDESQVRMVTASATDWRIAVTGGAWTDECPTWMLNAALEGVRKGLAGLI